MRHEVAKRSNGLDIKITEIEGKEGQLLEAFEDCQAGRCSCPTDEYEKLESLQVEVADGKIDLQLTAKPGHVLDEDEINRCLDYTKKQAGA
jgi:hypothetical protein